MKKIYLILSLIVLIPMGLIAQNDIIFTYDDNGNRVTREINMKKSSIANTDTLDYNEDQLEKQLSFTNQMGDGEISFFPNPVKQWLNIEVSGNLPVNIGDYAILNNNGQVIMQGRLNSENRIDLKDYPAGLYLLQIQIDNKKQTWKIVKD